MKTLKKYLSITFLFLICVFLLFGRQNTKGENLSDSKSIEEFTLEKVDFDSLVSGTFKPDVKPVKPPVRIEAGSNCIVDLIQGYTVTGALSGTFEIDYRILVHGACGEPPGTFNEEWIAHGSFLGKFKEVPVSGDFSYTAKVKQGGDVKGKIVFGQGITGELQITGNFKEGKLDYTGWIK